MTALVNVDGGFRSLAFPSAATGQISPTAVTTSNDVSAEGSENFLYRFAVNQAIDQYVLIAVRRYGGRL